MARGIIRNDGFARERNPVERFLLEFYEDKKRTRVGGSLVSFNRLFIVRGNGEFIAHVFLQDFKSRRVVFVDLLSQG